MEKLIDEEEYIEYKMNEQLSRLYLVPGVSMDTKFQPRTRKEIKVVYGFFLTQFEKYFVKTKIVTVIK